MTQKAHEAEPAPIAAETPKARILVVDDEVQVVHIFQDLLTQQGYQVEACDNGDDAILKVTTGKFDLVLTDINLPGVDGLEVIGAAKMISTSLSRQSTLDVVVAQAARLTSARSCLLFLHDVASDDFAAEAAIGVAEETFRALRFQMGLGYHGQVVQSTQSALLEDLGDAVGAEEMMALLRASNALIVPLQGNESVMGTITCLNHEGGGFSTEDQDMLRMLASQATIAITNAILC